MIRVDIFKATGHGFRFFADSLDKWHDQSKLPTGTGWVHAARVDWDQCNTEPKDIAEELFNLTNTVDEWWNQDNVTLCEMTPAKFTMEEDWLEKIAVEKRRSLSVGDVIEIIDTVRDRVVTLGCDSFGWKRIG
jgi:hypothetical protein